MTREQRPGIIPTHTMHELRRKKAKNFDTSHYRFPKITGKEPGKSIVLPENTEIAWTWEEQANYDGRGNLGLILQFSGIIFTTSSAFKKSRGDYGPNSSVYYCPVDYEKKPAFLILATLKDIFESQVVETKKDQNPYFASEIYLPRLTTIYDPSTMNVCHNNGLVIVGYHAIRGSTSD